jgi:glucose-1-phosphate thymidylyltransferase
MRGILLAGGSGSRLWPVTHSISKHLLPVFDKPMVYYPLSVLMLAGIRDILIITTPHDLDSYQRLLGNGSEFGVSLQYCVQEHPSGIAEAFLLGGDFIGNQSVCLVLGDNIFWGQGLSDQLSKAKAASKGATIFGHRMRDPQRFGVVEFDANGCVNAIQEKPINPPSEIAVTGLYFFDNDVLKVVTGVTPSRRGELEITSVLNEYIQRGCLQLEMFGRGFAWLDTGTSEALLEASNFIETVERQQGLKIACLEEIALNNQWIEACDVAKRAEQMRSSSYGEYLSRLVSLK